MDVCLSCSYGGSNAAVVSSGYKGADFAAAMATSHQVVYGNIDGRGSPRKSVNMMHAFYRNLGTMETYDQINVTRYRIMKSHKSPKIVGHQKN